MLELIRFTSGPHAEEFMAGRLYMSSLGYFWNNGFEGQQDMLEGTAWMQDPKESHFPKEWQSALCASIMVRAEAFQLCNLLCFHRHFTTFCADTAPKSILESANSAIVP